MKIIEQKNPQNYIFDLLKLSKPNKPFEFTGTKSAQASNFKELSFLSNTVPDLYMYLEEGYKTPLQLTEICNKLEHGTFENQQRFKLFNHSVVCLPKTKTS